MARSTNDILFRWLADTKSLKRGTRAARGDLKSTEKAASGVSVAMGGMQKAFIAAGGAMAIREVGQFIFDAAEMAEKAGIVSNSFEKIFEESSPQLRRELERTRLQVGLNSLEFEQLLLKTGLLLTGFGATSEEAAKFGNDMFVAAADLAAFTGQAENTDQALNAINRALVGEFDPLEQFVGGIKASTVAAKALELGLADTVDELTNQDKATALLILITEQASDAVGALAEQEGTLASQSAEASARLDDLKIQLGQELTPAIISATGAALDFSIGLGFLADETVPLQTRLDRLGDAVLRMTDFFNITQRASDAIGKAFRNLASGPVDFLTRKINEAIRAFGRLSSLRITLPKLPSFKFPSGFGFAQGGTVQPGQTALVGENGPELITPRGGASVNPRTNGNGGGSVTVNVNFNGIVGDPTEVAEQIQDLLEQYTRTNVSF